MTEERSTKPLGVLLQDFREISSGALFAPEFNGVLLQLIQECFFGGGQGREGGRWLRHGRPFGRGLARLKGRGGRVSRWMGKTSVSLTLFGGAYYHRYPGSALPECCGRNSVAECLLPKQDVVGSNPIARSSPTPFPYRRFCQTHSTTISASREASTSGAKYVRGHIPG